LYIVYKKEYLVKKEIKKINKMNQVKGDGKKKKKSYLIDVFERTNLSLFLI
jgi:hypothetical protein